jgi:hypothetical protein
MTRAHTFRAIQRAGTELPEIFRAAIASGIMMAHSNPRLSACRTFTGTQKRNSRKLSFKGKCTPSDTWLS